MLLLIQHAQLWDGQNPRQSDMDLLIQNDRIVAIDHLIPPPEGAKIIDATGATVIPGLIDSHVHLSMDPGAAWRQDSPADHLALLQQHLRAYLACGITTILDPVVLPDEQKLIESLLNQGIPGPRYLSLGAPFVPPHGYPQIVIPQIPSVATPADVEAQFEALRQQNVVGIKTTVEQGFGPAIWPLYSPDVFQAIQSGAATRGLRVYSHALSAKEQRIAMEKLGAMVMVHPLERKNNALIQELAAHSIYEMTTLSTVDAGRMAWQPERLNAPLMAVVPAREMATAHDPQVAYGYRRGMVATVYPMLPFKNLAAYAFNETLVQKHLRYTTQSLLAMQAAGIPIVMGSDSGNWPLIPYEFHGPTSIRELELLVLGGFSPTEALITATHNPSEMLGMDIGHIAIGSIADLLIVDGNPLSDITALQHLRYSIRAGEARPPMDWLMSDGPRIKEESERDTQTF